MATTLKQIKDMFTLSNSDLFRLLQHVPVGIANIAIAYTSPVAALLLGAAFLTYEVTQGHNPHVDIRGYCWGLAIAGLGWLLLTTI